MSSFEKISELQDEVYERHHTIDVASQYLDELEEELETAEKLYEFLKSEHDKKKNEFYEIIDNEIKLREQYEECLEYEEIRDILQKLNGGN